MSQINEATVRDSLGGILDAVETGLSLLDKEYYLPPKICTKGFIDLLAKDKDGRYVLIEVKRTKAASRETLHEILKYIEATKLHLGLRENELRVIVAAVDWTELMTPFSSFCQRTTCRVEGWALTMDDEGEVCSVESVEALPICSERILAPWHELRFYRDEEQVADGIASYEASCAAKGIESYVLVVMRPPASAPRGLPSAKQITMRGMLTEMAAAMGQEPRSPPTELYRFILYFAMQQLARDEYVSRLPAESETFEYIENMDEEEALASLHEAVLDLQPRPRSAFLEIAYAAKFKARLLEDEGWVIDNIRRYGAFARNQHLSDETIVAELKGAQGNTQQSLVMVFDPSDKTDLAELRKGIDDCLRDNPSWRAQIQSVLDELSARGEERPCRISVHNPSSALTTVYLAATNEKGVLYVPTYSLTVPMAEVPESMYFGCLVSNGTKPKLDALLREFYEGSVANLMSTLLWGGYEASDSKITRRMGLRYKTFRVDAEAEKRTFFEFDDGHWEPSKKIDPLAGYYGFLNANADFVDQVIELYSSRWDGSVVVLQDDD